MTRTDREKLKYAMIKHGIDSNKIMEVLMEFAPKKRGPKTSLTVDLVLEVQERAARTGFLRPALEHFGIDPSTYHRAVRQFEKEKLLTRADRLGK